MYNKMGNKNTHWEKTVLISNPTGILFSSNFSWLNLIGPFSKSIRIINKKHFHDRPFQAVGIITTPHGVNTSLCSVPMPSARVKI